MSDTTEVRSSFAFETITVNTAVGFTEATMAPDGQRRADMAIVTCETDAVRYRSDGPDPSSTVGHSLAAGASLIVYGEQAVKKIRFIKVTNNATLQVTYCRRGDS